MEKIDLGNVSMYYDDGKYYGKGMLSVYVVNQTCIFTISESEEPYAMPVVKPDALGRYKVEIGSQTRFFTYEGLLDIKEKLEGKRKPSSIEKQDDEGT